MYIKEHATIPIIKYWGDKMPMMCMEELAELQQAISKKERGEENADKNLVDEIGDVYITLEILMNLYNIDPKDIAERINYKLKKNYPTQ